MRSLTKLAMVFALGFIGTGCFVAPDPGPYDGRGSGPAPAPAPAPAPLPADSPEAMGALGMPGYHVLANASAGLPDGDLGYMITANGEGGYRITWTDTLGSAAHFSGSITTDGQFYPSSVQGYSGAEYLTLSTDGGTITFDSTPGTYVDGVDLVSSTDPIYLDLQVDGARAGFSIYFTGGESGAELTSAYDPVAFTSP